MPLKEAWIPAFAGMTTGLSLGPVCVNWTAGRAQSGCREYGKPKADHGKSGSNPGHERAFGSQPGAVKRQNVAGLELRGTHFFPPA
jgi:hypothetical protein